MMYERGATTHIEVAHRNSDGQIHGHSYSVECFTHDEVDLVEFHYHLIAVKEQINNTMLEDSVGDPTMEGVARYFWDTIAGYRAVKPSRIVVRQPSLAISVEYRRE